MDERTSFVRSQAWMAVVIFPNQEPDQPNEQSIVQRSWTIAPIRQSVYSKTCTTLLTPATVRTWATTASASLWLTSPIK